ncbi:hypothetical protein H7F15_01380 [Pontibacter sp. Tf4]|uniref:hypothetical protein n=1 Tax=Pontibacter sp. Tf4 TaxID=2761620 RepID=UPI001625749F|nr:hypothetical protein [Pontibacter sp. Tf4]MBB6609677.1 hypothetical protein [Pontibacter sp. Tf4]
MNNKSVSQPAFKERKQGLVNYSLNYPESSLLPRLKKGIVTLDLLELENCTYEEILLKKWAFLPEDKETSLNTSQYIWLRILDNLISYNFPSNILYNFKLWLFADIFPSEHSYQELERDSIGNPLRITYNIATTPTLLDFIIGTVISNREDLQIYFNKDGRMGFVGRFVPVEEAKKINGSVSFSVHEILLQLVGDKNLPNLTSYSTLVSQSENEVLKSMRTKEWESIQVDRAAADKNFNWLLTLKKSKSSSLEKYHETIESLPTYHSAPMVSIKNKTVFYNYIKRLRF